MPLISLFSSVFKPIGNSFKNTGRDLIYSIIPNSDLTFTLIPENDLFYNFILDNDVRYVSIPDNNLIDTFIFNNDILYTMVPNNDGSYILIPSDDINRTVLKPPVVFYGLISIGEGSGVCNGGCPECPTFYVTGDGPTFCESNIFVADEFSSMSGYGYITYGGYVKTVDLNNTNFATYRDNCEVCYYYYYLLNCNLGDNKYGRSVNPSLTGTYNVNVNTCYTIVGGDTGPSYDYDLDIATLVTDCTDNRCVMSTPTPTPTETPTPTPTPTIYYYHVNGYSCGTPCNYVGQFNVSSPTPLTIGYFYNNPENRGYTFEILSSISEVGGSYDLTGETGFTFCTDAC